jgi:6,7-dimethyl-8-ribityllumazine synthase
MIPSTEGLLIAFKITLENEVPAGQILCGMFQEFLNLFMAQKNVANSKLMLLLLIGVIQGKPNILILYEGVTQGIKDLNVQTDIPLFFVNR